jgi:hypothetical protein
VSVLRSIDWLVVLLVPWVLPLGLIPALEVTYFNSLIFWIVPIVALLPRFLGLTHAGSRRRRAFGWATAQIVVLGILLDFVFGHKILLFNPEPGAYVALLIGVAVLAGGVVFKAWRSGGREWIPFYFTYLVAVGFVPAACAYEATKRLVNWRALSTSVLYVLATSIIWEVTLAFPRFWWGYQPRALLGVYIRPWTLVADRPFPVEAVLVWLAAPFASVFTFELLKAYQYHPSRSQTGKGNLSAGSSIP